MKQHILITIGIPCYNAEKTIAKAINSALGQTCENWELIIIDDGSTDNSLAEINKICDSRVTVISRVNRGLPATLNEITGLANGEYLARMDADDVMFPDRLEKQLEYLEKNNDVDLLGAGVICIDEDDRELGARTPDTVINSPYQVFKGEVIFHPTLFGRSDWFKNNPYDESYSRSEDYELWCRTAGEVVIHNLQEPLLYYREYSGNTSLSKYLLQSKISRKVISLYGVSKIGWLRSNFLILRRLFKDLVYILLSMMGCWKYAVSKRN